MLEAEVLEKKYDLLTKRMLDLVNKSEQRNSGLRSLWSNSI